MLLLVSLSLYFLKQLESDSNKEIFVQLYNPGKIYSLSLWQTETAIKTVTTINIIKKIPRVLHLGSLLPMVGFILGVVVNGWILTQNSDLIRNCFMLCVCVCGGRGLEVKQGNRTL